MTDDELKYPTEEWLKKQLELFYFTGIRLHAAALINADPLSLGDPHLVRLVTLLLLLPFIKNVGKMQQYAMRTPFKHECRPTALWPYLHPQVESTSIVCLFVHVKTWSGRMC